MRITLLAVLGLAVGIGAWTLFSKASAWTPDQPKRVPLASRKPVKTARPMVEATRSLKEVVRPEDSRVPNFSMEQMIPSTELIIKGSVIGISERWPGPDAPKDLPFAATIYDFQVDRYMRGSGPSIIQVAINGGRRADGRVLSADGDVQLQAGRTYYLFGGLVKDAMGRSHSVLSYSNRAGTESLPFLKVGTFLPWMTIAVPNGVGVLPEDEFTHSPRRLLFGGSKQLVGLTTDQIDATIEAQLKRWETFRKNADAYMTRLGLDRAPSK